MFTFHLRKSWRKASGAWVMAASPRSKSRPSFRPTLEELEHRIVPTIWVVTGTGDTGQGRTNEGDLRYCMNNAVSNDTIDFGVSGMITLNSSLPPIRQQNLKIDGSGENVTIWGGDSFQIFNVGGIASAEIDNLSIEDGSAGGGNGGGLYNDATLTLKNDQFLYNLATNGAAIYNATGGKLTMTNVSLNDNTASGHGGGIANWGTLICNQHCSIVQNKAAFGGGLDNTVGASANLGAGTQIDDVNTATSSGGGVYQDGGKLTMTAFASSSAISGNKAPFGGGLFVNGGTVTLAFGVSVKGNTATNGSGGGIYLQSGKINMTSGGSITQNSSLTSNGGGIYVSSGKLTLQNVTVSNNKALSSSYGGGMYMAGGTASVSGGTWQLNSAAYGGGIYNFAGSLTLTNNVKFTKNTATNQGGGLYLGNSSTTTFTSCNVTGNSTNGSQQTTGWGVYEYGKAAVKGAGLTDNDDPNREPVHGD